MPKTREQIYKAAEQTIWAWRFIKIDEFVAENMAIDVVDTILNELNITLAPVIGEAK